MILYRKVRHLRVKRAAAPEPPFWCASTVAPYSARRAQPVAIDYLDLRASSAARIETTVCEDVTDALERTKPLSSPVLIDATEAAEQFFRRGEEALRHCERSGVNALFLTSTNGTLPARHPANTTIAIATWPADLAALETMFAAAQEKKLSWGVAVPLLYPITTDLALLASLAALAQKYGASFLASLPIEIDATAKHALAQSRAMEVDEETYATLFHAGLEPIHLATERHIAALAAECGMADFVVPPSFEQKTNWNGAILLTLLATRMMAMEHDIELAGSIARSARAVAELDKEIERIAAAAPLSIVQTIDEVSVDVLTDWLSAGRSSFAEKINREWRLRRDAGFDAAD